MSVTAGVIASRVVLVLCTGLLLCLVVRAAGWKRTIVGLAGIAAIGVALWIGNTAVWRDAEYRRVTDEFKQATAFPKRTDIGDGRSGWNEDLFVATGVRVTTRAAEHLDIATVQYS